MLKPDMKITWKHNLQTEILRVVNTAIPASNGFFRTKGFFLIPYEKRFVSQSHLVFLPELEYNRLPRFWNEMSRLNAGEVFDYKISSEMFEALKISLLKKNYPELDWQSMKKNWQRVEKKFFQNLGEIVPDWQKKIKKILIMPTRFGTSCSFNVLKEKDSEIKIFVRGDQGPTEIAEAILTSLLRYEAEKDLKATWEESEFLVDWLLTKSSLAKIFGTKFFSTLQGTRTLYSGSLRKLSNDFYRRLGLSPVLPEFKVDGEKIFRGEDLIKNLSEKELKVLRLMIGKEDKLINYREIGQTIYGDEFGEKFSLWGVSKFIQRLRDKLEKQNIGSHQIQTVYGQGFVLKN